MIVKVVIIVLMNVDTLSNYVNLCVCFLLLQQYSIQVDGTLVL